MAGSTRPPDLDREHFNRQHRFLLDRVLAHDQAETQQHWHAACAATLERDAAIAALLANQPDDAIRLFASSGNRLLKLGVLAGLSLSKFGHFGKTWDWRDPIADRGARLERVIRAFATGERDVFDEPSSDAMSLLAASARSSSQLIHVYYALTPIRDDFDRLHHRRGDQPRDRGRDDRSLRAQVRELLLRLPETTVGPLEIPLGRYIGLLDEISEMSEGDVKAAPQRGRPPLSQRSRDTFRLAILRRGEQLDAARADRKHWNVLPNPGNLIDLDLMALSALLVERTGSISVFDELIESEDPMLYMPLRAPEQFLRRPPPSSRHL